MVKVTDLCPRPSAVASARHAQEHIRRDALPKEGAVQAPFNKFTTQSPSIEPQNLRILIEFRKGFYRQASAATHVASRGIPAPECKRNLEHAPAWLKHTTRARGGLGSLSSEPPSPSPRRTLVKMAQIQPPALLLFHDFQPRFQLFQPPS